MKIKSNSGFTLAEILITLGIIGVVAALAIPSLLQNSYERTTVSRLRETQAVLSAAMRMAEEEYGDVEGWNIDNNAESGEKIGEYIKNFLKIAVDCGLDDSSAKCVGETYYYLNGKQMSVDYKSSSENRYKILLNNGTSIILLPRSVKNSAINNRYIQINIDTTGPHLPNTVGKDLFLFDYGENSLRAMGAPDSTYPYEEYCIDRSANGSGCAYYVLNFQNMNYLH